MYVGAVQVAVTVVDVTGPKTRAVGAAGTVASVDRLPVSGVEEPAPLTTVIEKAYEVPGERPLAVYDVVGAATQVRGPPSIRTW